MPPLVLVMQLLDEVFGRDESKMDEADRFLKAFIANKAWVDPSDGGGHLPTYGEVVGEEEEEQGQPLDAAALEEDEQFLEEADRYEAQYNFRQVPRGVGGRGRGVGAGVRAAPPASFARCSWTHLQQAQCMTSMASVCRRGEFNLLCS
jgi:hypothetical protein